MEIKGSITPLTLLQRIIVIMAGLTFFAVAIYIYADIFNFGKGVQTTQGTIISLVEERYRSPGTNTGTGTVYRPVVEFTVKGKKYKFLSDSGSFGYKVGQTTRVNYDPEDPSKSPRLAGKKELLWPAVSGLCGAIAVLLGVLAPSKKQ